MKSSLALCAFATAMFAVSRLEAVLVYSADFSVSGQGSTHNTVGDAIEASPISGVNWTISFPTPSSDTTTNEFITTGAVMRIQDWGGAGTLVSNSIDVTGWVTVDLTGTFSNLSDINASGEFLRFFYTLDGGSPVSTLVDDNSAAGSLRQPWQILNLDVSSASSMTIGFNFDVDGAGQGWEVSSLVVDGVTAVPEPAAALFGAVLCGIIGLGVAVRRFNFNVS
jgi:hypothetical protein